MRKLSVLIVLAAILFACGSRQSQTASNENEVVVLTVDDLLAAAADKVDQEVVISGLITHVCKHGGQRCFVMGATDEITIRVEAGDEIGSFKQEHVGDVLQITGILRLVPIDGGHVCSEDSTNVAAAEQIAAENSVTPTETEASEDYAPSYYIDGLSFIILSEGVEETEETPEAE